MEDGDWERKRPWIALNLVPNLHPKKWTVLLEHFSRVEAIWEAPLEQLRAVPGFVASAATFVRHRERLRAQQAVEREAEAIRRLGLQVLTLEDEAYPRPLRSIGDPPPVLYLKGQYTEKDELALAIVGTRRPTRYGRTIAEQLAAELVRLGFTIVSGLALGIDTAAHRGALGAGGRTIAVLGSGFARPYPQENRKLLEELASQGAVLSEFALEVPPAQWTFPQRNRIISGLSRGVVVVEAPARSGALITVRHALDQGREVFAVPGPVTSAPSRGTHALLKQGAKLVESVDDVLEEFHDLKRALQARRERPRSRSQAQPAAPLSPQEQQVFATLEYEPLHFNDLVERTGLAPQQLALALLNLQMQGRIKELEGKHYVKLP